MLLTSVIIDLELSRPIRRTTREQYQRSARYFSDFIGREAAAVDLSEPRVNLWLASLEARGLSPGSRKNLLRGLLVVWNHATFSGHAPPYARARLRKVKAVDRLVHAPTREAVESLLAAADAMRGNVDTSGVSARVYCSAYVRTAADTMLRPGDMRQLAWADLDLEARIVSLVQSKTGRLVRRPVRPETADALRDLRCAARVSCERVFPLTKWGWRCWERKLRKASAGWGRGVGLGHCRHAGATAIASSSGISEASAALGHVPGSQVAPRHYVASAASSGPLPW